MNRISLLALFAVPCFGSTVFLDGTFNPSDWQSTVLAQTGGAQLLFSQIGSGGNPGSFQQASFSVGAQSAGQSGNANIARFRGDFAWNPAADGPLGSMNFSMSLRNFSSTGYTLATAMFWRPVIVQSGLVYSVLASSLQATPGGSFETLNWSFTSQSDWVNFQNPSLRPDFSANGGAIQFGYRAEFSGSCPPSSTNGCRAGSVVDGLDNYRVELGASGVPEPATWALVAGALACAVATRVGPKR